jgi:hypothetical protein
MTGFVRRPTLRLAGLRAGGAAFLLVAVIALATPIPAVTWAQGDKTPAKAKPGTKPEELYGDQGGEKVQPATSRVPNTVMRARLEDTFFKLGNPRLDPRRTALLVDYEVVGRGKLDSGGVLVLRTEDSGRAEVELKSVEGRDSGTIQISGGKSLGGFKLKTKVTFPENVEIYVARVDDRYDPPLKCMVSNPVVMGKMKTTSRPRDWTPLEIARYTKPPLAYKNPNAHPTIGEDVPAMADGPSQYRYVDPDGHLLGLDYMVGDWDKRKAIWRMAPVYSGDQPKQHTARVIARKGYAVAGAEVNQAEKYLAGIRLLFGRVKPDGTVDPKDGYAGEWLGTPPEGKATPLVNDGRPVLGIRFGYAAVVSRFSLVAGEKAK